MIYFLKVAKSTNPEFRVGDYVSRSPEGGFRGDTFGQAAMFIVGPMDQSRGFNELRRIVSTEDMVGTEIELVMYERSESK